MLVYPRTCAVLGGGGFLGTNLCRRLFATGHRVCAFGRQFRFPKEMHGIDRREGDFGDLDAVAAVIDGCEVVYHLVHDAMPEAANRAIAADLERNVVPSIALLELCGRLGVKRVVFASSGGTVYGRAAELPVTETALAAPRCAYAVSKLAIEHYLALYEQLSGLDFRILRITNAFGPFQVAWKGQGFIAAAVSRGLAGEPIEVWGDGSVVRDFVFIDDVIDAFEAATAHCGAARIFNIGTGVGRSLREVIASIEPLLDRRLTIEWRPARALDVPMSVVAIERARDELGWMPKTSFEAGLAATIAWAQSHRGDIARLSR